MPQLIYSEFLKQFIGIVYNDENTFAKIRERQILKQGAEMISTLSQIQDGDEPYFSMDFLVHKFLGMSEDDMALNKSIKRLNRLLSLKTLQHQSNIQK